MKKWIEIVIVKTRFAVLRGLIENNPERKRAWRIENSLCENLSTGDTSILWVVYEHVNL